MRGSKKTIRGLPSQFRENCDLWLLNENIFGIIRSQGTRSRFTRLGSSLGFCIQNLYDCRNLRLENRYFNADYVPYNFPVDVKIMVDDPVPHLCHTSPFNVRVSFPECWREIFRCFTDYFNGTFNGMRIVFIMDQVIERPVF